MSECIECGKPAEEFCSTCRQPWCPHHYVIHEEVVKLQHQNEHRPVPLTVMEILAMMRNIKATLAISGAQLQRMHDDVKRMEEELGAYAKAGVIRVVPLVGTTVDPGRSGEGS